MFAVSYLAQFLGPIDTKIFSAYGYSIKKYIYHSIIWCWAVLWKIQDGDWIKICETFSGNSLKEDLSIDASFDPCYFLWDSAFKGTLLFFWSVVFKHSKSTLILTFFSALMTKNSPDLRNAIYLCSSIIPVKCQKNECQCPMKLSFIISVPTV